MKIDTSFRILKAHSTKDCDDDHVKVWLMSMLMTTQRRCILASRMLETRPSRLVGASSFLVKWWLLGALPWRIFSETLLQVSGSLWLLLPGGDCKVAKCWEFRHGKSLVSRNSPFCQAFVYKFVEVNAFASSPLKTDAWKMKSPVVSGRVICYHPAFKPAIARPFKQILIAPYWDLIAQDGSLRFHGDRHWLQWRFFNANHMMKDTIISHSTPVLVGAGVVFLK